jgi:hypothetical protein
MKIENLLNNTSLDAKARDAVEGGCRCCCRVIYKLVPVKVVRYICGVRVIYIIWKLKRIIRCR